MASSLCVFMVGVVNMSLLTNKCLDCSRSHVIVFGINYIDYPN